MKKIEALIDRIIQRVNINLRELEFDVNPYIAGINLKNQLSKFYAFYGITPHHNLSFKFINSSLAGSYFLGKSKIDHSILYKSDIRGDELKSKGTTYQYKNYEIPVYDDEEIQITDSILIKTLVHNFSHDPENLEIFPIKNTVSTHFTNIHGSSTEGCFLGPFSTVDLTTIHDCVVGEFSYIQVEELAHKKVNPGTIRVCYKNNFDFHYQFSKEVLKKYIDFDSKNLPTGLFMDFVENRKVDFENVFEVINRENPISIPKNTALDRYAVVRGQTRIGENVLVAQRAYLEDASLGKGANAQENCYIINSHLEGYDITAHGAKIINSRLGEKIFVGFNSFVRGKIDKPLIIGDDCIVMPHTIIDLEEPLIIPSGFIVWGYIKNAEDLKLNGMPLESFSNIKNEFKLGNMKFKGNGNIFIDAFKERIDHILHANGAFFDISDNNAGGHAQKNQDISFNTIQPYPGGDLKGIYPTIEIKP
ncbi:MAG: transferase [Deltaproteobacteria bacterium]|nr:transferase [Deltaproteobacteria bacterium]